MAGSSVVLIKPMSLLSHFMQIIGLRPTSWPPIFQMRSWYEVGPRQVDHWDSAAYATSPWQRLTTVRSPPNQHHCISDTGLRLRKYKVELVHIFKISEATLKETGFKRFTTLLSVFFPRKKLNQMEFSSPYKSFSESNSLEVGAWHGCAMTRVGWWLSSAPRLGHILSPDPRAEVRSWGRTCNWPAEGRGKLCLWSTQLAHTLRLQVATVFSGNLVFLWCCDPELPLEFHSFF